MAGLTLAQARTNVGQLLDDANNRRWTAAQVDLQLAPAIGRCLVQAGRATRMFDLEVTGTTSATDGTLAAFPSIPVLEPLEVQVVSGNLSYRIEPKQPHRRGYLDLVARSLRITYVRDYALPANAAWPLVGVDAVSANTWLDFDNWICAEAALELGMKDLEDARLNRLEALCAKRRATVLQRSGSPGGYPMPRAEWRSFAEPLRWSWVPATQTICLFRADA